METDPFDDTGPNYPEPNAVRRYEPLQEIAFGRIAPPPGQPRPTIAGIFVYWLAADTVPGLARVNLPVVNEQTGCLLAYLHAAPAEPREFGRDIQWLQCEVVERLPGDRPMVRLAQNARSEWGAKDFVVRQAQVFE